MDMMSEEELLKVQLDQMKAAHRVLDAEIEALDNSADPLQVKRLKKRKLLLKDQIARMEDKLYPDIIA